MSLIDRLIEAVSMDVPDIETEQAVVERAEDLLHETTLSETEALVAAADENGLDGAALERLVYPSTTTIRQARRSLRQRRRELDSRALAELEAEKEALDAWADA